MSQPTANPHRAGFTLVELLLVLALAVAIAAIAAPSVTGTLDRVRLDGAAEQVRRAWSDARLQAIRDGEPIAFQAQVGAGGFTLCRLADAGLVGAAGSGVAAAVGANGQAVAQQGALSEADSQELSEVVFAQVSTGVPGDPLIDPAVAACVVFRADGSTDDAFAIIRAADGRQRTITLRGLTGAVRIVDSAQQAEATP